MAFEIAEREPDPDRRRAWLTFVIVGGGPTGVELAGTLAEVSRQTLARDFRHINTASARVILIEAGPRVLGAYTDELSELGSVAARETGRGRLDRNAGDRDRRRRESASGRSEFTRGRCSGPRAWQASPLAQDARRAARSRGPRARRIPT